MAVGGIGGVILLILSLIFGPSVVGGTTGGTNTGTTLERSDAGLLSTAAWRSPAGELTYALEGAIFVTGAAVQWLRDGLKLIAAAGETERLASGLSGNNGVYLVPAFVGLGAPYWRPEARGAIFGLTRATTEKELMRKIQEYGRMISEAKAKEAAKGKDAPPAVELPTDRGEERRTEPRRAVTALTTMPSGGGRASRHRRD